METEKDLWMDTGRYTYSQINR